MEIEIEVDFEVVQRAEIACSMALEFFKEREISVEITRDYVLSFRTRDPYELHLINKFLYASRELWDFR